MSVILYLCFSEFKQKIKTEGWHFISRLNKHLSHCGLSRCLQTSGFFSADCAMFVCCWRSPTSHQPEDNRGLCRVCHSPWRYPHTRYRRPSEGQYQVGPSSGPVARDTQLEPFPHMLRGRRSYTLEGRKTDEGFNQVFIKINALYSILTWE